MSIKATVDNVDYSGIDTIVVGGKTIALSEISSGPFPRGIVEIKTGIWTQASDSGVTKTITHGCSARPSIILLDSNFRSHYSDSVNPENSTLVIATWFARGIKTTSYVSTSFEGGSGATINAIATGGGSLDGSIVDVGDTTFSIGFINTRRNGGGLTYRWYAIVLSTNDEFTEEANS